MNLENSYKIISHLFIVKLLPIAFPPIVKDEIIAVTIIVVSSKLLPNDLDNKTKYYLAKNEVKTFLNNLGISDSDISRVAAYYLK